MPDYFASRFSDSGDERATRTLRLFAAGALALFVTIYVSAQIDATGKAFDSLPGLELLRRERSWASGSWWSIRYPVEFVAVAWSDLFQGIMMALGLDAASGGGMAGHAGASARIAEHRAFARFGRGLHELVGGRRSESRERCSSSSSYLAIGLGFLGSPQVFVRFISISGRKTRFAWDAGSPSRSRW